MENAQCGMPGPDMLCRESKREALLGPASTSRDAADETASVINSQSRRLGPRPLRMHQDSRQVEELFNPVRGVRDQAIRDGKVPVDHAKKNRKAIAEASKRNALLKVNPADEKSKRAPVRRPSANGKSRSSATGERDFVHANIVDAGTHRKPSAPQADGATFRHKSDYGKVPTYLHERKMELAATYARQQAEKEAALIPEGMRMMSDEERLDTLAVLDTNRSEVELELQKLPFHVETPSQIRLKNQLERRLGEIEDAKKIFSRPKVLVKA